MPERITHWLRSARPLPFALFVISASFITYFSMYAFRKPLSAGVFSGQEFLGIDYKILVIFAQLAGYTASKFAGIRFIAELRPERRTRTILLLIGSAWISLLLFAVVPSPYNLVFLVTNGFPLGMIWGVVFSFLEGRRMTELLGAGLSTSFILSSGVVKSAGRVLVLQGGVSEFWMPFLTGLLFVPPLLLGVAMLGCIPPPDEADRKSRTRRVPMDAAQRRRFFATFSGGIVLTGIIYVALTIFRDVRDNFAVEIWSGLGFGLRPEILATAEIPIAFSVFVLIALMMFIRNNRAAFYVNIVILVASGIMLIVTTGMYSRGQLGPAPWMVLSGFAMYVAYIAYHTFLFERWIAVFRVESNIGFLMYIVDSAGYLGSAAVLFSKSFLALRFDWLAFFIHLAYGTGTVVALGGILALFWFLRKERSLHPSSIQPS
jgi:hypothetical protein